MTHPLAIALLVGAVEHVLALAWLVWRLVLADRRPESTLDTSATTAALALAAIESMTWATTRDAMRDTRLIEHPAAVDYTRRSR